MGVAGVDRGRARKAGEESLLQEQEDQWESLIKGLELRSWLGSGDQYIVFGSSRSSHGFFDGGFRKG